MPIQSNYLFVIFISLYGILLGIYFIFGTAISFWNQRVLSDKKIQSKTGSKEEINRDIFQSVKSLMFIALLLAGGIYCQHIGFTIRPQKNDAR